MSRLARLALFEEGLQPGVDLQVQFYQSKSSCLQALAIGNVAACGLPRFALPQLGLSDTRSYKVVYERKLPVGLTFAVHNRLVGSRPGRLSARPCSASPIPTRAGRS